MLSHLIIYPWENKYYIPKWIQGSQVSVQTWWGKNTDPILTFFELNTDLLQTQDMIRYWTPTQKCVFHPLVKYVERDPRTKCLFILINIAIYCTFLLQIQ